MFEISDMTAVAVGFLITMLVVFYLILSMLIKGNPKMKIITKVIEARKDYEDIYLALNSSLKSFEQNGIVPPENVVEQFERVESKLKHYVEMPVLELYRAIRYSGLQIIEGFREALADGKYQLFADLKGNMKIVNGLVGIGASLYEYKKEIPKITWEKAKILAVMAIDHAEEILDGIKKD